MKRWTWIIPAFALGVFFLLGGIRGRAVAGSLDDISIPEIRDRVIRAIEGSDKKTTDTKTPERKEDYNRRIERRVDWLDGRIHQLKLDPGGHQRRPLPFPRGRQGPAGSGAARSPETARGGAEEARPARIHER